MRRKYSDLVKVHGRFQTDRTKNQERALISLICRRVAFELAHQPGPRKLPIPHDGLCRYGERFGCLLHAQAAEKSQLDDSALALIQLSKCLERVIQRNQVMPFVG